MFLSGRLTTLLFTSLLFVGTSATAASVTFTFDTLPGADGIFGTADDSPVSADFLPLSNEFSSAGLTFQQGTLERSSFFNGDPNNLFLTSTSPIATFSMPVYGISIQSKSYWDATLTAYDSKGNIIATNELINPNAGSAPLSGTLSVSSVEQIYSFSVMPNSHNDILNLDNLTLNLSPVPEPSSWLFFALGLVLVSQCFKRSQRKTNWFGPCGKATEEM